MRRTPGIVGSLFQDIRDAVKIGIPALIEGDYITQVREMRKMREGYGEESAEPEIQKGLFRLRLRSGRNVTGRIYGNEPDSLYRDRARADGGDYNPWYKD